MATGLPLELQVLALDEVALIGLPGEIFVETGLAIAESSPFFLDPARGVRERFHRIRADE